MNNFKENLNSNGNIYLARKREKEPIQKENKCNYDNFNNYYKYGNYGPSLKYNCFKKYHPFMKDNYFWNRNYKYRTDYYQGSKNYFYKGYPNRLYEQKNYSKYYHKNFDEGIKNISKDEEFYPQSLSLKEKEEEYSLNSIPCSTNLASPICHFNSKEINKEQENSSNEIYFKLSSYSEKEKGDDKKPEIKEEDKEKDNIFKLYEKLRKYEFFHKDSIKLEDNPLKNLEVCPKNLFKKIKNTSKNNNLKDNTHNEHDLSLESSYLLAKIQNWRLISKFVPISSLKNEKFETFLEKCAEDETIKNKSNKNEEMKSYLVYSEKYEDIVNGCLKDNMIKKKKIKFDIMNRKLISDQLQRDIFEIKKRLQKNKCDIKFLDAHNEHLCNTTEKTKNNDNI